MLKSVILRLDFSNKMENYNTFLPKELRDQIVKLFQIAEPRDISGIQFQIGKMDSNQNPTQFKLKEWNFYNISRTSRFCITEQYLLLETSSYTKFDEFKYAFFSVLDKFKELNPEFIFSRVGFSYVNVIENNSIEAISKMNKLMMH